MNKLIQLNNKIKIKYVNITGLLDYEYEKYRVNSARELVLALLTFEFLLEEYLHIELNNFLETLAAPFVDTFHALYLNS